MLTQWLNSPAGRRLALGGYYHATRPLRACSRWAAARRGTTPIMVLFYHRVADHHPNDWTIGNAEFEWQVHWMRERFEMVSLAESQRRMQEGNSRPAVSITFDDGYADNCHRALPLLIKLGIPCTYFVATRFVLRGEPFPHDVAAGQPLRPNTPEELRALADAGIELGGHTRTHADLGQLSDAKRIYDEVIGGAEELTEISRQPVRYFAFPYGRPPNLNAAAYELLRQHRFRGVCSAYGGYNTPGDASFHIQRIHGDPEFARLRNWLTVDPRKRTSMFRWQLAAGESSDNRATVENCDVPSQSAR